MGILSTRVKTRYRAFGFGPFLSFSTKTNEHLVTP